MCIRRHANKTHLGCIIERHTKEDQYLGLLKERSPVLESIRYRQSDLAAWEANVREDLFRDAVTNYAKVFWKFWDAIGKIYTKFWNFLQRAYVNYKYNFEEL